MIYLLFVENLKVFLFVCLFLSLAFGFDSEVSGCTCFSITLRKTLSTLTVDGNLLVKWLATQSVETRPQRDAHGMMQAYSSWKYELFKKCPLSSFTLKHYITGNMLTIAIWKCDLETVYDLNSRYHQMGDMETWMILWKPDGCFFRSVFFFKCRGQLKDFPATKSFPT